jgi:hypothetical protein
MGGYIKRSWIVVDEGVHWMHLAQDRGLWRVLVKKVVIFRRPQKEDNYVTGWAAASC